MDTISRSISASRQSVVYTELMNASGIKLRIMITSDFYADQCQAAIHVFNHTELKWNALAGIHSGAMSTRSGLKSLPNSEGLAAEHFMADRNELIAQATAILDLDTTTAPSGPRR